MDTSLPPIEEKNKINNTSSQSKRFNAGRNATVGNATAQLLQSKQDMLSIDEKLTEQFKYFRAEFINAANSSGVPVQLNIVEDKSGQYYKFVQNSGPKFLFDVIQNNTENIHLVRCALSVLIIIVTLLRRKLPPNFATKKELEARNEKSEFSADPIATWVIDSLTKIGDVSSVSVCIGVLISSFNPSIQELALSLLASILVVSDEAVAQMTLPSTTLTMLQKAASESTLRTGSRGMQGSEESEPKANLRTTTTHPKKTKMNLDYRKFDSTKFNYRFNQTDYSSVTKSARKRTRGSDKASTCLSFILSVVLIQKNRHLLTAGCADIILAMLRLETSEMCQAIAETPTCELPKVDALKNKGGENRVSRYSYNPQPAEEIAPSTGPRNPILEWAGLKLLLKFLFRFEKISAQSDNTTFSRDTVSASLRLKDEFSYTHSRVFTAVCRLISGSQTVASQVMSLAGAEELLEHAYTHYCDPGNADSEVHDAYDRCTAAFEMEKQQRLKMRRSSVSAGTLFNTTFPGITSPNNRGGSASPSRGRMTSSQSLRSGTKSGGSSNSRAARMPRSALQSVDAAQRLGSPSRTQRNTDKVQLVDNIEVPFEGEFEVETEKKKLYLLNEHDDKYLQGSATGKGKVNPSDLQRMSRQAKKEASKAPLSYKPNHDELMLESLKSMDQTIGKSLNIEENDPNNEEAEDGPINDDGFGHSASYDSFAAASHTTAGSSVKKNTKKVDDEDEEPEDYDVDLLDPKRPPDVHKDLFEKLPAKPKLPRVIQPNDVVTPHEDLTKIRNKFNQLAHKAVYRVEQGDGYMRNGKNSISIDERARRVYAPVRGPDEYGSQFSRAGSKASRSKTRGASSATSVGRDSLESNPDMFASFHDDSGALLENVPINPDSTRQKSLGSAYLDDFDPESSADENNRAIPKATSSEDAGEQPSILGLRLENFDFDEGDLFEGFKPIFDYPVRRPEADAREAELKEDFEHLDIGRKAKVQNQMDNTVDLLL